MIRKIIHIDQEKCNGCGACANACHEGAIEMVNGKAVLTNEHYCDGLGDCLPACPTGAIRFEEREAPAYDEAAVRAAKMKKHGISTGAGCPGSRAQLLSRAPAQPATPLNQPESQLRQWPVQIKPAPVHAPYFDGCELLIAADCTAYACGSFHADFIRGRVTLIGCPKLDRADYEEKLTAILTENDVRSVTLTRMEVPCCGGLEYAARQAVAASGKDIPMRVVTFTAEGKILPQDA